MTSAAVHIVDDDRACLGWLTAHREGWIANTRRKVDPGYFVLHKLGCISVAARDRYRPGAFAERNYSKVVASSEEALRGFMKTHGIPNFSNKCSRCGA